MAPTRIKPDPTLNGCTALPLLANETIVEQPVDLATLTGRYTDEAVTFISGAAARQQPFFLYMAYHDVHVPHACSEFCGNGSRPFSDALLEARAVRCADSRPLYVRRAHVAHRAGCGGGRVDRPTLAWGASCRRWSMRACATTPLSFSPATTAPGSPLAWIPARRPPSAAARCGDGRAALGRCDKLTRTGWSDRAHGRRARRGRAASACPRPYRGPATCRRGARRTRS